MSRRTACSGIVGLFSADNLRRVQFWIRLTRRLTSFRPLMVLGVAMACHKHRRAYMIDSAGNVSPFNESPGARIGKRASWRQYESF
jgi:hypothetical protein